MIAWTIKCRKSASEQYPPQFCLNLANDDEGHPGQREFKVTTLRSTQNRTYRDHLKTYHTTHKQKKGYYRESPHRLTFVDYFLARVTVNVLCLICNT